MCMNTDPVNLVRDAALQSERNGEAAIYWGAPNTYAAFRGAKAISLSFLVLSGTRTSVGRVFAETSLDGITWNSMSGTGGLISAGMTTADYSGPLTANPSGTTRFYAGGSLADAAFVRFGVQVEDDDTEQAELRLTLTATPVHGGGDIILDYGTDITQLSGAIGTAFSTVDADQVSLMGTVVGAAGTDTDALTLGLFTGSSDTGPWADTTVRLVLGDDGGTIPSSLVTSADKALLSSFCQVQFVSLVGLTGTLFATVTVRPIC